MLGKTEVKVSRPRGDGRHCDLCGCSFPAVRCDKCGSQIFCLSCDDMYHRHPKRRFHLRKAVDPTPTPQARPVLPMKVSQLASTPGDPSKMPLPPPRKKKPGKSFFDSFRRGSPSSDNSPPLPKKEYSWTDRLGSIKKFMSNRPLPPLPKDEDLQEQKSSPPLPRKNDLSFIHKRVDEKPPQLPHRMQAKSPVRKLSEGDSLAMNQENHLPADKQAEWTPGFGASANNFRQVPVVPATQHLNGQAGRDSSERELSAGRFRSKSLQDDMSPTGMPNFAEPLNLSPTMPSDVRGYSTLKRPSTHGQDVHNQSFMSMPGDSFPGMQSSSSVTDLHSLDSPPVRGPQQFPNFPMPPHYPHPYPMYPHYPNYPQYFGTSFANLTTALPNTDGDFSDQSDASSFSGKKHHKHSGFNVKAKRSQSVMFDRMAYPPQYYPFGGFPPPHPVPGYGAAAPWGQSDHPIEAPPSPATSVRSFGRSHKSRHRKKKMVVSDKDDEDERLSVRSSPRSRTTSSSDRFRKRKTPKKFERSASPSSLTSSVEEEEILQKEDRLSPEVQKELSQGDGYQTKQEKKKVSKQGKEATKSEQKTKQHGSKMKVTSHQKLKTDDKNFSPKFKKKDKTPVSSSESMDVNEEQVENQQKTAEDVYDQEDTEMREESDYHYEENENEDHTNQPSTEFVLSDDQWQCEHCTFINSSDQRICQVCCKTKPGSAPQSDSILLSVPETHASSSAAASPDILTLNTTSESLTSDTAKEYLTPPAAAEDGSHSAASENEGQNFEKLNSDLEQAEKELSRGLMELMKLKEESDIASTQTANISVPDSTSSAKEVITTQNNQLETKTEAPNMEVTLPQLAMKTEPSSEQTRHDPNVPKTENFSSKSIGTDSMDLDFPMHPVPEPQVTTATRETAADFGLHAQGQISPANSSSEIRSSAPSSQKDISGKPAPRRDSSCQTYQDDNISRIENEIPFLSHTDNMDFHYPLNRADSMKSPQLPPIAPPGYRGYSGRGQGLMHRSHSRSSLFGDRYGDARAVPPEFDNLGFGFGPSPMYRSLSRSSLTGDYSDPWMSDVRSLRRPDFYLSMEELVERRRLETKRAQGLELVRMIREAEQQGFTADDIHVALNNCGKQNPVDWLQTNWRGMVDTVVTLATNYGKDKHENDIGVLSENETRDALRMHKGNIWAAVTECVEGRQRKFLELKARGNFSTKEIVDALTQSEGNVELAYTRLSATTLKPFLMRIWGAGEGVENQDGAVCDPSEFLDPSSSGWPKNSTLRSGNAPYTDAEHCSDQEDWDDDEDVEDEVSWNEDEEDETESPENFDIQPKAINRDRRGFMSNHIATPESDSEYCDAFDPVGDIRSATSSSPVDEIFFVSPDSEGESQKEKKKGTSFLSRLAALRKNKKPQTDDITEKVGGQSVDSEGCFDDVPAKNEQTETKIRSTDTNTPNSDTNKIYSPLNILKQTFSAIKDSVIGSNNKGEAKHSRSITEARTIIVHDRTGQEVLPSDENVTMKNYRPLKNDALDYNEQKVQDNQKTTDGDIIQIAGSSISKENEPVYDRNENINSLNDVLSAVHAIASESPKSNTSIHKDNLAIKQENSETSQLGIDNATDITDVSHRTEKQNDLANSVSTEKKSVQNSVKPQSSIKIVENSSKSDTKPLVLQPLEPQPQEESPQPMDLIADIKDSNSKMRQSSLKTLEEGGKAPTQGTGAVTPEKNSDSAINSSAAPSQLSLSKPVESTPSGEVSVVAETKSNSDNPELSVSLPATKSANDALLNGNVVNQVEKSPNTELIRKDEGKTKIKKVKEGLRLKLPNTEQTPNSEMSSDLAKVNGQKDHYLARKDSSPSTTVFLGQNQESLRKKSDTGVQETISQCLSTPANENTALQKPQETGGSLDEDRILMKPDNSSPCATNVNERSKEIVITDEKLNSNISENEFHDMASKITEKMENCLEVLKSSEAAFTETQRNIPSSSGNEQPLTVPQKSENKLDSVNQGSENAQGNADNNSEDVPKIPTESEKSENHIDKSKVPTESEKPEKHGVNVQSSKSSKENKESRVDSDNKLTDTIKESHPLPDDGKLSDTSDKHALSITKHVEQPSTSSAASKENESANSATSSFADETSDKKDDPSKTANEKPSESQTASLSPTAMNSGSTSQVPVIYPGVKAKTFAGGNRKAKSQFTVNETKQKDFLIHSERAKATTSFAQNKNISDTKKDTSDVQQEATKEKDIDRDEKLTQPHQSETESRVSSITNSSKGNVSSSVSSEQRFSITPIENNIETPFSVRTDDQKSGPSEHPTSMGDLVEKQPQQNVSETLKAVNSVVSEKRNITKFERVDSIERVKEPDTNISSAVVSSKELVVSSSKDSDGQTGEANALFPSPAVSSSDDSKDDQLNAETKEETNSFPAKEDNASSSSITSGVRRPASRVEALKNSLNDGRETRSQSPIRPQSPFGRMTSLSARKEAIAQERSKDAGRSPTVEKKPWFIEKVQPPKPIIPKRSIKQQLEFERKIRKLVSERKCRTYRKAEVVVQLLELNFAEEEALHAAHECSTLEQAISYLQQECLLCAGMYPVGRIVSMIHCPHKACKECIKAYFTIQIRDRTIMELLCPFCNEPDISDEDVAQDYFNHLDILLKKLVETDIHELFQRKLRDRVLMKDPNFRWCSQCSSGFIAMPNLKRLICPDCNAITCASCRRPWQREHEGISCEAFADWKDANDPEAHAAGLAKLLQEDGIACPNCHFRYSLAKGGCMHFRCIQCQHDFCSGCSKPFKMGQKCGVSDYCGKLGLHAHHPRNCLFYLRDKDPEDLQRLLELNDIEYNKDQSEGMELKSVCQVMEQKETSDGLVDDICGKEVLHNQAGLCRVHYVEYLGQLVNKHKIDPIQIFCNDDLELVLRRASKRLPAKGYRDSEVKYREKLVQLIQEELPLEQTEGS